MFDVIAGLIIYGIIGVLFAFGAKYGYTKAKEENWDTFGTIAAVIVYGIIGVVVGVFLFFCLCLIAPK